MQVLLAHCLARGDELVPDAALDQFDAGGTRLRLVFATLAAQFGPTADAWQVTVSGVATELIHLAALCHDEVVDDAEVPCNASRADTRSANNAAILAGDYRFARASHLGAQLGQRGFQVIAEAFAEMVTGRMRETLGTTPGADPIAHYLRCAQEKAGSLVAAAGQLGATFSGASEQERVALSRLGRIVGAAFQIFDELVDVAGALRRRVHTLPVLYALSGRGPETDKLRATLNDPVDDGSVADALAWVRSSPGMQEAKKVLAGYVARARAEIASLPDCAGRKALSMLIDGLILEQD